MSESEVSYTAQESRLEDIKALFKRQQDRVYEIGASSCAERRRKLKALHEALMKYRSEIYECMYAEYKKPQAEVDLSELYVLTSEIKNARKNLHKWMRSKAVSTPISLLGTRSYIKYEAKGTSLIIAPWNFPLQLCIGPLISAVAAGCPVILKPSEMTPLIARLVKKIVAEVFDEDEVAVIEGGVETSTHLLSLPFDHIFFTGSTQVGKIVMRAAAQNLSSVTLELGGKSPAIVDETADVKMAASRIARGKFFNNGQICIAPDYVLVHEDIHESFIQSLRESIETYFGKDASASDSYGRIVNKKHFDRLKVQLDRSVELGARVIIGGEFREQDCFIEPTVVFDAPEQSDLLQEEIFGPILPVISFQSDEQAIQFIRRRDKPLSLYVFSKSNKRIQFFLNNTRAGGGCINNADIHYYNHQLPFGGVKQGGMGKAHGYFGFREFTNERAILKQVFSGPVELLGPPYTRWKQKLIDLTIKWL